MTKPKWTRKSTVGILGRDLKFGDRVTVEYISAFGLSSISGKLFGIGARPRSIVIRPFWSSRIIWIPLKDIKNLEKETTR